MNGPYENFDFIYFIKGIFKWEVLESDEEMEGGLNISSINWIDEMMSYIFYILFFLLFLDSI